MAPRQKRQAGSCAVCSEGAGRQHHFQGEPGSGTWENVGHRLLAKKGERRGCAGRGDETWWCVLHVTPSDPPFSARSFVDKEMWLNRERWEVPGHEEKFGEEAGC